ncbi:MAG: alpha/beta fold hydrolase [Oscillospiraceae bacterium]|nr:alpha/beta fold hydrolase [Oscillospiraceae bacterium]
MKPAVKAVLGVSCAAAVLFAAVMAGTALIMKAQFRRGDYPFDRSSEHTAFGWYPAFAAEHPREEVEFPSGDLMLKGWIYGAENTEKLIVFAHGIGSGHEAYVNQLCWFADRGWCVFAYDAAGSGDSPGNSTVGLVQSALDLHSALTFAEQNPRLRDMPKVLLGHSWGGYAVGGVLNFDHDIKAAASLSGYAYPLEMLNQGAVNVLGKTGAKLIRPFAALYNKLVFGRYAGLNAVDGINKAKIPFLAVHGESDEFVLYSLGIISQQEKITAPGAEYVTITGDFSHHNDYFHSEECNRYVQALYSGSDASQEELLGMFSSIHADDADKALFRVVNEPLLEQIEAFYAQALHTQNP